MTNSRDLKSIACAAIVCAYSLWGSLPSGDAQETAAANQVAATASAEATHDAIRELRDALIESLNQKDIDGLMPLLHDDVVLTAQDGEELVTVRKRDGVKAYIQKLLTGPDAGVRSLTVNPQVDELTILHGDDTGVAFGSSSDSYVLRNGMEFVLDTRWSATIVLVDEKWQVANLHVSSNLFDNPVTKTLAGLTRSIGIASGLVGLILGSLITYVFHRRRKQAAESK